MTQILMKFDLSVKNLARWWSSQPMNFGVISIRLYMYNNVLSVLGSQRTCRKERAAPRIQFFLPLFNCALQQ